MSLGYTPTPGQTRQPVMMPYWEAAIGRGREQGRADFYDDQDMKDLRARRMDLSQGYSSQELGALKNQAMAEIGGQRAGYMNTLRANLAKGGVGGARAAAIQGAADQKFAKHGADAEQKILLDSAKMKREGVNDLQDFLFKQKYGMLGTGLTYGGISAAEEAARRQRSSASDDGGGFNPFGLFGHLQPFRFE